MNLLLEIEKIRVKLEQKLRRLTPKPRQKHLTICVSMRDTEIVGALIESVYVLLEATKFCEVGYGSYTAWDARKKAIALLKDVGIEVED